MWNRHLLLLVVWASGLATVNPSNADELPNIILFIGDDISWNDYGCYGNAAARTPSIDALAANGLRFTQAFLTASSCSPSRSSIITGRYPHNTGKAAELHLAIAGNLPWFPTLLRETGYFTALVGKHHMKATLDGGKTTNNPGAFDLIDGGRAPGNSGGHGKWVDTVRQRPKDKPFFFWFASYDAHRAWEADREWDADRYGPMHDPANVVVPPFLVDDPQTRQDLASYHNEVTRLDYYIGQVVDELRRQAVLDNTMIFVMADNGRPFPRAKTRLHDSGMKTALVAHWPAGIAASGASSESLVGAIDLAPTILDAAGVDVPEMMQGVSMTPIFDNINAEIRRYAFSEHNWHDYEAHGRSVRDGRFLYIRNNRPQFAWQGPADSVRSPSHRRLQATSKRGDLTDAQSDVFLAPRPEVELYDTRHDPHQLDNLSGNAQVAKVEQHLADVLGRWSSATRDSVPADLSRDSFDRETGERLDDEKYRGTTPGEDMGAVHSNAPGPR